MKDNIINRIVFLIVGILLGVVLTIAIMPKKVAKLSDGSEEVVTVGNRSISADEYYGMLKGEDKLSVLLRNIDVNLLKDKYTNQEKESSEYAEKRYKTFLDQAQLYGYDEKTGLQQYGYSNKEDFINYLKDDYYLNKYYEEKLSGLITDNELQDYYATNYFAPKHVYVFSVQDDTTQLNQISKELKKGMKISKVISKYSDIPYNEIDITFTDNSYGQDFLTTITSLKKGDVSSVLQSNVFGNYVVYVESVGEKQSYEDVKDQLKEAAMTAKESEDPNTMYKVMIDLQKENNISFKDSYLNDLYKKYVNEHYK